MRTLKSKTTRTLATLLIAILFSSTSLFAGGNKETKENTLSYELNKGSVDIKYISMQDPNSSDRLTLKNIQAAQFSFTRNMNVNNVHIASGEYEVSLIEFEDGLGFNFHALDNKKEDVQIALDERQGVYSEWLNYDLQVVEDDKIAGKFNWKESTYTFTMEVSISNSVFTYLQKEELENTVEWIDYYQAAIYAYKNNIDLDRSFSWAKKALHADQNEHTIELNMLYLEALGRDDEAQQLSALIQ